MKSKYQTLKDIVKYVTATSANPISELLTMGFDPYQLVNVFKFDADEVKASDVYRDGNWDIDQKEDPFRLDLYEPFDAALVSRFKLTNDQFAKFKDTTVYTTIYNAYMDDKASYETDLFNEIFNENEDNILDELEFIQMDEEMDAIDDEPESNSNWIEVPLYLECANYAYEAGEMDAYKLSKEANLACKEAIESAISVRYNDNRLAAKEAVDTVVSEFGWDRVKYVLAVTINAKKHDGRLDANVKAWATTITVAPEESLELVIDSVNPGLIDLLVKEVIKQTQGSCIIGVTEDCVRMFWNETSGWTPESKNATVYADLDKAREVWASLDKKGFSRVFVPVFDPAWLLMAAENKDLYESIEFLKTADPKYLAWYKIHAEASSKTKLLLYAKSLREKSKKSIRVLCKESVEDVLQHPENYLDLQEAGAKKALIEIRFMENPGSPKTISLSTDGSEYFLVITGKDLELPAFAEEGQTLLELEENLILGLR